MTKSTGIVNLIEKYPDGNHQRPNLSGLMTRKRLDDKILNSNKKFVKDNHIFYGYEAQSEMNKIIYKGLHNVNNGKQQQNVSEK
jgi:hypothetical protein